MYPPFRSVPVPTDSALRDKMAPGDFVDCFAIASDMPVRQAAERIVAFPPWVLALLALRGVLTAPFGLLQEGLDLRRAIGPFPIESETETEIIAGFNDRHLDFRVAVRADGQRVCLATWVHRHNLLGRAYLALILPFHIMVARDALRRVG